MITSDSNLNAKSPEKTMVHWHATPECFHCQVCRKSLLETKMTMKFGLVLCSSICAARAAAIQYNANHSNILESDLWIFFLLANVNKIKILQNKIAYENNNIKTQSCFQASFIANTLH